MLDFCLLYKWTKKNSATITKSTDCPLAPSCETGFIYPQTKSLSKANTKQSQQTSTACIFRVSNSAVWIDFWRGDKKEGEVGWGWWVSYRTVRHGLPAPQCGKPVV